MSAERPLREALLVFLGVTAVVAVLYRVGGAVPIIGTYLHAFVAVVFLYVPVMVGWRHKEDIRQYGFNLNGWKKSLALGVGGPLIVFPLFAVGFVIFYSWVCAQHGWLQQIAPPGLCRRFAGWAGFSHVRLPDDFLELAFSQVVVVALPEELFFRGFLLKRLEQAFPPKRRFLGGGIGLALFLSAVLFALGHVLVDLDPRRFAVFFPGLLFGWMRSATDSVAAGTVAHASSNVYIEVLHRTFFR